MIKSGCFISKKPGGALSSIFAAIFWIWAILRKHKIFEAFLPIQNCDFHCILHMLILTYYELDHSLCLGAWHRVNSTYYYVLYYVLLTLWCLGACTVSTNFKYYYHCEAWKKMG
jgi:hypothetical protein